MPSCLEHMVLFSVLVCKAPRCWRDDKGVSAFEYRENVAEDAVHFGAAEETLLSWHAYIHQCHCDIAYTQLCMNTHNYLHALNFYQTQLMNYNAALIELTYYMSRYAPPHIHTHLHTHTCLFHTWDVGGDLGEGCLAKTFGSSCPYWDEVSGAWM